VLAGIVLEYYGIVPEKTTGEVPDESEIALDHAEHAARESAGAILSVIEFAEDKITQDEEEYDADHVEQIQLGLFEWDRLQNTLGFNLHRVLMRRQLVPFVLIPRHVANKRLDCSKLGEEKMRIAQVAPLFESVPPRLYGGTERIVSYLTEELVRLGHDVTLFASGDSVTSADLVPGVPMALRLNRAVRDPIPYFMLMMRRVHERAEEFDVITRSISAYGSSRCLRGPALNSSVRSTRRPRANSSAKRSPRAAMMQSCQNRPSHNVPLPLAPIDRPGHPSPTIDAKSALAVRERRGARGLARLNRFWYFARGTGNNSRGLSQKSVKSSAGPF
jgi:hypothetical protein